jgi:hypothetical protein
MGGLSDLVSSATSEWVGIGSKVGVLSEGRSGFTKDGEDANDSRLYSFSEVAGVYGVTGGVGVLGEGVTRVERKGGGPVSAGSSTIRWDFRGFGGIGEVVGELWVQQLG